MYFQRNIQSKCRKCQPQDKKRVEEETNVWYVWLNTSWRGLRTTYETRAQSFNAYTHIPEFVTDWSINLSQITLGIKLTSACHPKLKQSHKNARYYIAVLHWSAVGKFEAKHREDETNSDIWQQFARTSHKRKSSQDQNSEHMEKKTRPQRRRSKILRPLNQAELQLLISIFECISM